MAKAKKASTVRLNLRARFAIARHPLRFANLFYKATGRPYRTTRKR